MTITMAGRVVAMLVGATWMGVVACSDDEGFPIDPTARAGRGGGAGRGGSSGGGSGVGGTAGLGGAGGSVPDGVPDGGDPDGGLPRFVARLDGEGVSLSSVDDVWVQRCSDSFQMMRREGDGWTPLRDDRPEGTNLEFEAHYLDGALQSACRQSLGCDLAVCEALATGIDSYERVRLVAREFVSTGQAAAPTCDELDAGVPLDGGADAGVRQIPDIQSSAPEGPLGVSVRFHTDASCSTPPVTIVVPVE